MYTYVVSLNAIQEKHCPAHEMLLGLRRILQARPLGMPAGLYRRAVQDQAAAAHKDSRSEAAQESVVGNASSKKKERCGLIDRHKKLVLQLTPMDDTLRIAMTKAGLNPGLELVCR